MSTQLRPVRSAALVAVLCVVFALFGAPAPTSAATGDPTLVVSPACTGDGYTSPFVAIEDGQAVRLTRIDRSEAVTIDGTRPAWSSTGSLAVLGQDQDGEGSHVVLYRGATASTIEGIGDGFTGWLDDDELLDAGGDGLHAVSVVDGQRRLLVEPVADAGYVLEPAVAPDGTTIAYLEARPGLSPSTSIWEADATGWIIAGRRGSGVPGVLVGGPDVLSPAVEAQVALAAGTGN